MRVLRFREAACVLDDIAGEVQSRAVNPGVSVPARLQTASGGYVRSAPKSTTAQGVRAWWRLLLPSDHLHLPFPLSSLRGVRPQGSSQAKASAPFLLEQLNYPGAVQNVSPVMAGSPSGVGTTQGLPTTNPQPGR